MAGSQDPNDNPVAINVVPMVDVIFCLCVFFMCSFKFKQLEGKFDSWLPRQPGIDTPTTSSPMEETRVALFWDEKSGSVTRQIGSRRVKDDAELQSLLREARDDWAKAAKPETPVTIDSAGPVPWREVVNVINLCKRERIDRIEFAYGTGR